ncbi:MAG: hypothetical protein KC649_00700 [Candidatus Omnitrophica bacterium]|nr:hypothetical protein [Candidatus Omnitrophota bacterium]
MEILKQLMEVRVMLFLAVLAVGLIGLIALGNQLFVWFETGKWLTDPVIRLFEIFPGFTNTGFYQWYESPKELLGLHEALTVCFNYPILLVCFPAMFFSWAVKN